MSNYLFKDRDGQTPLPPELRAGLRIKTIQSIGELDEYEEDNIIKGISWLNKQSGSPLAHIFWIKLHKKLFENVWNWAGKIRGHELANPDFTKPQNIRTELYQLERDLKFWVENSTYSEVEIAARFHEKIEIIHPFANGNGRFGRIITEKICNYLAYEIPTWGEKYRNEPDKRREAYISALRTAEHEKRFSPLVELMFS